MSLVGAGRKMNVTTRKPAPKEPHTVFSKRLTLLTAAAASAAAFALPAAAQATPCVVHLPGPGDTWDTASNGTLAGGLFNKGGKNFDTGHGLLKVNGVAYPAVDNQCASTTTAISYPARSVGGLTVSRSLSVVGNTLRYLDTIYNPAAQGASVDVDWGIDVSLGQRSVASEVGSGFEVSSGDHWAVLENDGDSNPFLQWGQKGDGAHDPTILSADPDSPTVWKPHNTDMPNATLKYDGIAMGPKSTIRVLHVIGSADSQAAGVTAAKDRLKPFTGYTKATASTIVNWGNDTDADGVNKFNDACPAVKGNTADGCTLEIKPPVDDPDPKPPVDDPNVPVPPVDPGNPGNPGNPSDPGNPGNGGTVTDKSAPTIKVSKLSSKVKRSKVGKLAPKVACNEACRITIKVQVVKKGRKKATTVLSTKATSLSKTARTIKLKVKGSKLKSLKKQRLSLVVTARDAAGNTRTVTKVVTLNR